MKIEVKEKERERVTILLPSPGSLSVSRKIEITHHDQKPPLSLRLSLSSITKVGFSSWSVIIILWNDDDSGPKNKYCKTVAKKNVV